MPWWVGLLITLASGLVLVWLALLLVLARLGSAGVAAGEAMRLMPDVLRLLARLARDNELPRSVRLRLWFLLAYLASPLDLIPDFIPVIGYADDIVVVAVILRSVVRKSGEEPLAAHWPGTAQGLAVVRALAGLPSPPAAGSGNQSTSPT